MTLVVDSSALVAIVNSEEDAPAMAQALVAATHLLMSAATYMECSIVVRRKLGSEGLSSLIGLCETLGIEIVPLSKDQSDIGIHAYAIYGQGSRHPARLNFGDCFSYALAKSRDLPLLFKGDDFGHTDLRSALSAD